MLEQFHFIRPLWLLALLPLAALVWRLARRDTLDNPWRQVVDARVLPLLMRAQAATASRALPWLLAAGWLIAVLALADPTWQRRAQPVFQTSAARVVVLDLSSSMNAADLQPSRLVRARYKVEDILRLAGEGLTGLVAYAGDAFTVAPLTRDANTVRALLKVLEPSLMPVQGERADLGLLKAGELLRQAGVSSAQVLLIADGVDSTHAADADRAAAQLHAAGYRVSVLGVGTGQGAALQSLARAGGGSWLAFDDSGAALRSLLDSAGHAQVEATTPASAQAWHEQGPLLVVLLLPLAALAFRRNWLFGLVLLAAIAAPPRPAMASTWDDLWQRPDQQAAQAMAAGDYAKAAAVARDPAQRGSAEYKRGKYQMALQDFARAEGSDADYNRGNALARLGRYEQAIQAYDQALAKNPSNEDARVNKSAVQAMLQRQPPKPEAPSPQAPPSKQQARPNAQDGSTDKQPTAPQKQQAQSVTGQGAASAASGPQAARAPASGNEFADAARKLADSDGHGKPEANPPPKAQGQAAAASAPASAQAPARPAPASAEPLNSEEKMAAEQWLRNIPDDPGGLLRRKFLYQYRQRAQAAADGH